MAENLCKQLHAAACAVHSALQEAGDPVLAASSVAQVTSNNSLWCARTMQRYMPHDLQVSSCPCSSLPSAALDPVSGVAVGMNLVSLHPAA